MKFSYKLAAMKLVSPSKEHLEKHYEDLSDKPFYKGLVTCTQLPCPIDLRIHMDRMLADVCDRHVERPHLRHGLGGSGGRQDWPKYVI